MFINAVGYYIPPKRIPNSYFESLNGLTGDWITQRTGIQTRSRATEEETMDYMCEQAIEHALPALPYAITEVDLIVYASYSPSDTIATPGYLAQRKYNIPQAKVFYISSACSSAINAIEIIRSFFSSGSSTKALMICADRNSTYSSDKDKTAGHLWGDGAVAYFFSKTSCLENESCIIDVDSQGLGHIGQGPQGVYLRPQDSGIQMPYGKDVFLQACTYMTSNTKNILEKNRYRVADLNYFIGHQANKRILKNVAGQLNLPEEKVLTNIEELGNTGSASAPLVFAQKHSHFKKDDLVCISVFGGGYSCGACLIKIG